MDTTLVYMVAGLSSRFNGKTKALTKVGPNNETLMEYSLSQALPAGFTKIIFIVSEQTAPQFKEKFKESYNGIPVEYAFQKYEPESRDKPWGTCDALCSAKEIITSPIVVCNGDDLYGEEPFKILTDHLRTNPEDATIGYKLGKTLSNKGGVNRGIFRINQDNTVETVVEKLGITKENLQEKGLNLESLCSMNIFACHPETIDKLSYLLKRFKKEHQEDRIKECFLPNQLNKLINRGQIKMKLYPTQSQWYGLTHPEDKETLQKELSESKSK